MKKGQLLCNVIFISVSKYIKSTHMLVCVKCALCHGDNSLLPVQATMNPTLFRSTSDISPATKFILFPQYDIKIKLGFLSFLRDPAHARTQTLHPDQSGVTATKSFITPFVSVENGIGL